MKLYIVTLPNMGNIGGMLQTYALYRALMAWRHDVSIIDFAANIPFRARVVETVKKLLYRAAHACGGCRFWQRFLPLRRRRELEWLHRMYSVMGDLSYTGILSAAADEQAACVIGSDQVWRAAYTRYLGMETFFLSFASPEVRRRSIAYAASFGHDAWDATAEEETRCRPLARELRAISVREHSGVVLCREKLGVDATQMPDPAFLLNREDYEALIRREAPPSPGGKYMAAYVLDHSPTACKLLHELSTACELPVSELERMGDLSHSPLTIPQWLHRLQHAECLVTDSFHGCVFALIFNKPFVCIGNEGRGGARFDTLLQTFRLESRLVADAGQALAALRSPIDWEQVNAIRERERQRGFAFLKENLASSFVS